MGLDSSLVELVNVSRIYQTKSKPVNALVDVSLTIQAGERVCLLGRSGSGKSTLLNLLGGLDRPTIGTIRVNAQQLDQLNTNELSAYRLSSVGIIFQAFNLIATKSALQNVELPFVFAGHSRSERREKALQALDDVGLKDRITHKPSELSGGEQQRVAVARALVNRPSLLLADEPTGNLDSKTATSIMQQLSKYSDNNEVAVLLVTHDEELARKFAHRTIQLRDGRLAES